MVFVAPIKTYLSSGGNPARLFIYSALTKSLKISKIRVEKFDKKFVRENLFYKRKKYRPTKIRCFYFRKRKKQRVRSRVGLPEESETDIIYTKILSTLC